MYILKRPDKNKVLSEEVTDEAYSRLIQADRVRYHRKLFKGEVLPRNRGQNKKKYSSLKIK